MTSHTPESLTIGANLGGETPSFVTVEELLGRILAGDPESASVEATLFSPIVESDKTTAVDSQRLDDEEKIASAEALEASVDHEHVSVLGLARILTVFEKAGVGLDNEKGIRGLRSRGGLFKAPGSEENINLKPKRSWNEHFDRLIGKSPVQDSLGVAVGALVGRDRFAHVSMHLMIGQQPLVLTLKPNEVDKNNVLSLSARLTRESRSSQ